jgi:hypothetical protein
MVSQLVVPNVKTERGRQNVHYRQPDARDLARQLCGIVDRYIANHPEILGRHIYDALERTWNAVERVYEDGEGIMEAAFEIDQE